MNGVQVLALLATVVVCGAKILKDCGPCDRDACPQISNQECLAGKKKDECNCCDVCYKSEGEKCDLAKGPAGYGDCGNGLVCSLAYGDHYCFCESDKIICGRDGVTYNNICQMYAAEARSGKTIGSDVDGPCDPAARIVTPPVFTKNYTGGTVVLLCEATGNPVPYLAWLFTRVDGKSFPVPGDDDHQLTACRGGPAKYQVTGWLQIEGLAKKHEGDYTCVAKNGDTKVHAKARVKVVDSPEEMKERNPRRGDTPAN